MFAQGSELDSGRNKDHNTQRAHISFVDSEGYLIHYRIQMKIPACSLLITIPDRESGIVAFLREDLPIEQLLLSPW